ncbi:acetate--CoA ligase family protein [Cupriavidus pauculus]|uniref:acetate--CoA ligase family protein n=1 Tax=Cupriavidus pauculus TaxID=82633 RepID=UPI001EE37130|nr:acetate--CoA ligase family protein [Cupriavidus pauculus]GJG96686.1 acetate--CoA ligase family protein [Cupriavidus pauculus]
MSTALQSFLRPRSIALVGASERSTWSNTAYANLRAFGYSGHLHMVNRSGTDTYGQRAATTVTALGEPVDLALLMVPADAAEATLDDLREAGIRNAVMLASGFAETGAAGAGKQASMLARARSHGITLLGPNCVGYLNYVDRTPVFTIKPPLPALAGSIAVISQSGAVANLAAQFAHRQHVGLSYMITTGNEADLDSGRLIDFLVDDPATRAVALFLETVRDTERFAAAARRALEAGKPVVVLKIGASEITAKSAQAHTGSLVGDDRVFDAVCRSLGVVRVNSIEDMVVTTEVMARVGVLAKPGIGLASISGGICEIMGDRSEAEGLTLPPLAPETAERLREILPDFGTIHNPLDVTGAMILKPELLGATVAAMCCDPGIGLQVTAFDVPISEQEERAYSRPALESIQRAVGGSPVPALVFSHTLQSMTDHSRATVDALGINYLPCGVHHGLSAIARTVQWSARQRRAVQDRAAAAGAATTSTNVRLTPVTGERVLLTTLGDAGVPVVPQHLATDEAQAADVAAALGCAVALKIASPDIAHKTEAGGVVLSVQGDDAVRAAFRRIMTSVRSAAPDARIDGVLVAPMRTGGTELFVGIHVDPQWGPVLALGLGGIWVEVLKDTSLRRLPVREADVRDMLDELRGTRLLDGFRGQAALDRDAIARAVVAISDAALAFGPALRTLEINPLLARPDGVEALDALAEWQDAGEPGNRTEARDASH